MTSTRLLAASLAALVFAAMIFVLGPGLDLRVAAFFARAGGGFVGQTPTGEALRRIAADLPVGIMAAFALLFVARRLGWARLWAPNGAGLLVMALSLALGPGLLVNTVLKDHSHRPRPAQVMEFGGTERFQPFFSFSGECPRNCSFVSGEGSSAFWTLAPAMLLPPPARLVALAAAVAFGAATGTLRMAFGGHFLSDTVFAALLTWLVVLGCWRLVARVTGQVPGQAE